MACCCLGTWATGTVTEIQQTRKVQAKTTVTVMDTVTQKKMDTDTVMGKNPKTHQVVTA